IHILCVQQFFNLVYKTLQRQPHNFLDKFPIYNKISKYFKINNINLSEDNLSLLLTQIQESILNDFTDLLVTKNTNEIPNMTDINWHKHLSCLIFNFLTLKVMPTNLANTLTKCQTFIPVDKHAMFVNFLDGYNGDYSLVSIESFICEFNNCWQIGYYRN
ncbi:24242_t:CDS:1, partial [Racocetra persica]